MALETFGTTAPEPGDSERRLIAKILDRSFKRPNGTALASAARTVTTLSASLSGDGFKGVILHLNCTVASGTGGLTLRLVAVDPVTGASSGLAVLTGAITAIGHRTLTVAPGVGALTSAGTVSGGGLGLVLPDTWQVQVIHGDATSYTYSITYELIP